MLAVGFEPTRPQPCELESHPLDHSGMLGQWQFKNENLKRHYHVLHYIHASSCETGVPPVSVVVITLDFESNDPGSNPGRDSARVAQWTAHQTSNLGVRGSSPRAG